MLWAYDDSSPSLANELPPQAGVSPGQASSQHPGLGEPGVGPPLPACPQPGPVLCQRLPALIAASASLILICHRFLPSVITAVFASPERRGFGCQSCPCREVGGVSSSWIPQNPPPRWGALSLPACCCCGQGHPGPSVCPQILFLGLVLCATSQLM